MYDWVRSLALLATAFVAVVVGTLGLSGAIVPDRRAAGGEVPVASGSPGAGPIGAPVPTDGGGIPGIGGTLTASGDYEGTLRLTRESISEVYSLEGSDVRIVFGAGSPAVIDQISFDGWQFFPDPEQCSLTPGNLDGAIGIGFAKLACTELEEIRDKGTVDIAGEVGMSIDRLAARTLPDSGGALNVGDETWAIGWSYLATWQQPILAGVQEWNLSLADEERGASLNFTYDIETHRIAVANVERDGEDADVDPDACRLEREELGKHNPRTTVIELTVSCAAVEVPGLGAVAIDGSVVVDELAWPEF